SLRGTQLARFPPSRNPLHRDLRVPDLRTGRFPPQDLPSPGDSKCLPYPVVTDPAAPPIRPQRHVPDSIATLHRRLAVAIARTLLPRCPCCARRLTRTGTVLCDAVRLANLILLSQPIKRKNWHG